jgi:hypothetical protein
MTFREASKWKLITFTVTEFAGRKCSVAFIQRRVAYRFVVFVKILRSRIVAAIAATVFITNTPGAKGM